MAIEGPKPATQPLRDRVFADSEPVRVSICSITFNHANLIRDCLEGFLDQVCDFRVEVVIHDDASTDGTAEIIRDYAARYPQIIRPILQSENQFSKGVNPYYAYVFPATRSEYIAICDGDDHWKDPGKLAMQVAVLDQQPGVALTYGRTDAMQDDTLIRDLGKGAERDLSAAELKSCQGINTLTSCFRNVFRGPPPRFLHQSPIGDLTVWAVLGYHGTGRFLPDLPPAHYTLHSRGIYSLAPEGRKTFMLLISQLCIAAYHMEQGDRVAMRRSLGMALRSILVTNGRRNTLKTVLRDLLRQVGRRLRGRR
jgi:glycosyltransferase involved in cell wall biosynthesis